MREGRLKKIMLERGMKGYDSIFIFGLITSALIYLITNSFIAAITIASTYWACSIFIFICYRFELADDYYKKVKSVTSPKGNRFSNMMLGVLIIFVLTAIPFVVFTGISYIFSSLAKL